MARNLMNLSIRERAKEKKVKLWEVADKLGIVDSQFSRELRHELPQEKQERILLIIDEIASGRS